MRIKAMIAGLAGLELTSAERRLFQEYSPWGYILFARNIATPEQTIRLTETLRECSGRPDTPILIDQEGGRVQRLHTPQWPAYPPARFLGNVYATDRECGLRAAWLQSRLIAFDLRRLGITVNCLPVLDVPVAGAHDVIGDRAYSMHPFEVEELGRAACHGLIEGGVLPVIKHIPGHGRSIADSHEELPRVEADLSALRSSDFMPFQQLSDMPIAMTAHVVYSAIDAQRPATISPVVIDTVIRSWIGFNGLLISDDLSMRALTGAMADRTNLAIAAGCDIVLHCNGDFAQMQQVAEAAPVLAGAALDRVEQALERLRTPQADDEAALRAEFARLAPVACEPAVIDR
jgi:beta-N-acetylhexosaminidase